MGRTKEQVRDAFGLCRTTSSCGLLEERAVGVTAVPCRRLGTRTLVMVLVVAACGDDPVRPPPSPPPAVASVEIDPPSLTLAWGHDSSIRAVVKDASGRELTDREVTW